MPDRMQMYNLLLRLGVGDVLEPDFVARICVDAPARRGAPCGAGGHRRCAEPQAGLRLALHAGRERPAEGARRDAAGRRRRGFPAARPRTGRLLAALPADYKLKGLKLRWFFKEALRGFLPDAIIAKKKQGFGLPFGVWVTRHEGLKRLAVDSLASLATRGIVRAEFIRELLDRRLAEHPGYYGEMVWILMMLEQWLRSRRRHAFV